MSTVVGGMTFFKVKEIVLTLCGTLNEINMGLRLHIVTSVPERVKYTIKFLEIPTLHCKKFCAVLHQNMVFICWLHKMVLYFTIFWCFY
jgi:hypothetical protein